MQLKKKKIRGAMAMATCSLLTAQAGVAQAEEAGWDVRSSILFYSEKDRVSAVEPIVRATKDLGDEESVAMTLVLDTLTGASPNGAIAADRVQTFTSPSGDATYTAQPGETPLNDFFHDTRVALNGEWIKPFTTQMRGKFGANFSTEYDYLSLGANAGLAYDLNQRNTTLSAEFALSQDSVEPVGSAPVPLTLMSDNLKEGNKDKSNYETLFGITQVLSRKTLMQLNYSYGTSDGYLTDPYKIVSLIDGTTGESTGEYLFENRPDSRARQSLYWKTIHHFKRDVLRVTYRYFWDDWGVRAHTFDLRYRYELGGAMYLQPHFRYSAQSAADFYTHSLIDGAPLPDYASADYRLGEMDTTTLGLKFGMPVGKRSEFAIRGELVRQEGDSHPSDAIGVQREQDLFPTVDAYIVQLNYNIRW